MATSRIPYRDMVLNAFKDISDSAGLTRDTINEYVRSKYNIEEDCDVEIKRALKVLIKEGLVVQNSDTKRYHAAQKESPSFISMAAASAAAPVSSPPNAIQAFKAGISGLFS